MDSADSEAVRAALRAQGQRLQQQEEQIAILRNELLAMASRQESQVVGLGEQVSQLVTHVQQLTARDYTALPSTGSCSIAISSPAISGGDPVRETVPSSPFPHLARPQRFSGESGDCRAFLTQCELHFELQAAAYPTDRAKVAFVISHLSRRAESWAGAVVCDSYVCFTQTFTQIFQNVTPGREAARALVGLQQGKRRVSDYAIEFRILAAESGWNSSALCDAFYMDCHLS